jgi:TIR domain
LQCISIKFNVNRFLNSQTFEKAGTMAESDLFLFVSHVAEDRDAAMEIVDELERRGVKCWIAPRNVTPGSRFDDDIADAIDASRAMLLIFSGLCNESEYIHREVTVAGESQKIIIPFRIEDVQPRRGLRVRLSDLHWIDGFVSRERAIEQVTRHFISPQAAAQQGQQEAEERPRPELEPRQWEKEHRRQEAERRQRQEAGQRQKPAMDLPEDEPAQNRDEQSAGGARPGRKPLVIGLGGATAMLILGLALARSGVLHVPVSWQAAASSESNVQSPAAPPAHMSLPPATPTPPLAAAGPAPPPPTPAPPMLLETATIAPPPPTARALESPRTAAPLAPVPAPLVVSRFDGTWEGSITCPPTADARGYSFSFLARVSNGDFHAQHGMEGTNESLTYDGKILADGTAEIWAHGLTGPSAYTLGHLPPGSPVRYRVTGRFEVTTGTGIRTDGRPCNLSFTKK